MVRKSGSYALKDKMTGKASVQTPILKLKSSVIVLVALYERRLQVFEIRVLRESYNLICRTYHK
jgi:hypothetical protein